MKLSKIALFVFALTAGALAGPVGAGFVAGAVESRLSDRELTICHTAFMLVVLVAALAWTNPLSWLLVVVALFGLVGPPIGGWMNRRRELAATQIS